MIKVATKETIHEVEDILYDAVQWMNQSEIPNLWNEKNVQWSELSKNYKVEDFYIYYMDGKAVGCMALTQIDQTYWSEVEPGKAVYIHKLAVKREASGRGVSRKLIDYAKSYTLEKGLNTLRLDCNAERDKLRKIYEREGFQYVRNFENKKGYQLALYVCNLA